MGITFAEFSAGRSRLQVVANGLRDAAGGAVLQRAAAKVQTQVDKVAHKYTSAHVLTGAADGSVVTTTAGGLVQLTSAGYLLFHGWWPFRDGMPPFVISNALKIFSAELAAALSGAPSPLALAEEAAAAAAAAKATKKAAREAKAAAKAERDAKREAKREARDAKREARIKAIEDRE